MLIRLLVGAGLFGLGYYFGRESTRDNVNQGLTAKKDEHVLHRQVDASDGDEENKDDN